MFIKALRKQKKLIDFKQLANICFRNFFSCIAVETLKQLKREHFNIRTPDFKYYLATVSFIHFMVIMKIIIIMKKLRGSVIAVSSKYCLV